jgi:hypothetical protein
MMISSRMKMDAEHEPGGDFPFASRLRTNISPFASARKMAAHLCEQRVSTADCGLLERPHFVKSARRWAARQWCDANIFFLVLSKVFILRKFLDAGGEGSG